MAKYGKKARLLTMLAMTFIFFLAEIITGYLTNSMALVADSFHMLSDVLSIVIGFLAVYYSGKKSETNTYDWARAEVLGAMANAVFLMALVFTIVIAAIQRLVVVEPITQPLLVLGVGAAGLLVNVIGLVIFGGHAHGHSHGHGHGHGHSHDEHESELNTVETSTTIHDVTPVKGTSVESSIQSVVITTSGKTTESLPGTPTERPRKNVESGHMNMQGVFLHVLGDALGSVVVICSALIIHFVQDDWRFYVDPVMSLVTSVIISCSTIPLLRRASMILLQNPPRSLNVKAVSEKVSQVPGVISVHDLHVWQLSGNCVIATVHVVLKDGCNFTDVARKLKQIFHEVDIHATTIQPEYFAVKKCSHQLTLDAASEIDVTYCECCISNQNSIGNGRITELNVPHSHAITDSNHHHESVEAHPLSWEESDESDTCLMSCVSDDCSPYMCCDGVRQRNKVKKTSSCYANAGFMQGNVQEIPSCHDDDIEACDRL